MDTPNFPCSLQHDHRPDGAGCSTPVIPDEAYRTAHAMRHHARGDALEYLGAPRPTERDHRVSFWDVGDVVVQASVRRGVPLVTIDFFDEPRGEGDAPVYARVSDADVAERWLLAALAAVHDARARASMEVS